MSEDLSSVKNLISEFDSRVAHIEPILAEIRQYTNCTKAPPNQLMGTLSQHYADLISKILAITSANDVDQILVRQYGILVKLCNAYKENNVDLILMYQAELTIESFGSVKLMMSNIRQLIESMDSLADGDGIL